MPKTSYSQNGEDILLSRLFEPEYQGLYIDIGANDPTIFSVTKHFYERGWNGINVEPGEVFAKLKADRPRDVNLNVCVSEREGIVTFYEFPEAQGWSTCDAQEAEKVLTQRGISFCRRVVPCMSLASICERYVTRPIDFLSIDVEGHERDVLKGGDWARFRPRAIVIEATLPNSPDPSHDQWEDLLLAVDYEFATFDGLNRYYIRGEERHLTERLRTPVNVFDGFVPQAIKSAQDDADALRKNLATRSEHWEQVERELRIQVETLSFLVNDYREKLGPFHEIGPDALNVAKVVKKWSTRYPRLSRLMKRAARRLAA